MGYNIVPETEKQLIQEVLMNYSDHFSFSHQEIIEADSCFGYDNVTSMIALADEAITKSLLIDVLAFCVQHSSVECAKDFNDLWALIWAYRPELAEEIETLVLAKL